MEIHIDPTEPLPYDTEHLVLSGLTPTAIDDLADVIGSGSGSDLASVEIRHPRQGGPMTRVIQEGTHRAHIDRPDLTESSRDRLSEPVSG